jgi:hypothetical protein
MASHKTRKGQQHTRASGEVLKVPQEGRALLVGDDRESIVRVNVLLVPMLLNFLTSSLKKRP